MGMPSCCAKLYVFHLFQAHLVTSQSGVGTRKTSESACLWLEKAATCSSRVGKSTHPCKFIRRPIPRRKSTVSFSLRRFGERTVNVAYFEKRPIEYSSSTTQSGIPRRPRLRIIPNPWKSPPTTTAPGRPLVDWRDALVLFNVNSFTWSPHDVL